MQNKNKGTEVSVNGHRIPDPKLHQLLSFIKSAIRIVGYILIPISLISAAIVLVFSEVIGIIEELV
tara:strand:- start:4 stop:201 length:198 start_codon:yes stop_codon:yes gene_type:complete